MSPRETSAKYCFFPSCIPAKSFIEKNNANIRRKPTKQVKLSILFFFNGHPPFWFLPEVCFSYEAYPKEVESQKQAVLQ